jgi:hypothetical protein
MDVDDWQTFIDEARESRQIRGVQPLWMSGPTL